MILECIGGYAIAKWLFGGPSTPWEQRPSGRRCSIHGDLTNGMIVVRCDGSGSECMWCYKERKAKERRTNVN